MHSITFNRESINFQLDSEAKYISWITNIAESHDTSIGELNYVFTSDEFLYNINLQYLNHDYFTDIISFPMESNPISGDIFISIDRVKENAVINEVSFNTELLRVMSHGLLHFIGFDDHNIEDIKAMREAEDEAIKLFEEA